MASELNATAAPGDARAFNLTGTIGSISIA
jgi:hypothetical protein